jgi:sugar lactone lactonase YvrE
MNERAKRTAILMILALAAGGASAGEMVTVPVDSDQWTLAGGRVMDHLDRMALAGGASLDGVVFTDGTIEVDVAVTGSTSYPGIDFRIQPDGDAEHIYLRPHRIARYGDGVQYTPKFNGVSCWQLYNGDGATAGVDIPAGEWFTLRLEVAGDRARVFVNDLEHPVLLIEDLRQDGSPGAVSLSGPPDGSAFFSNFRYSLEDPSDFGPPAWQDKPPGFISRWELSDPLDDAMKADDERLDPKVLDAMGWHEVTAERSGLVNISRHVARTGPMPDAVFARTTIHSEHGASRPLDIGYSDHATVYLNGEIVFTGRSAYRERDPSFLGIIGPFDTVYLPLDKGDNQLVIKVTEVFGGWGLMARWRDGRHQAAGVAESWSTDSLFAIPESVVWDSERRVFYVSNYDGYKPSRSEGVQSISRISADGGEVQLDWVTGLRNPVGLAVDGDRLWAAERTGLVEIDIESASVVNRYPAPQPAFPNDTAVDGNGGVFVSDPRTSRVYRLTEGALEVWLEDERLQQPNGIHVVGGEMFVGANGDQALKAVDIETKNVRTVARLGEGIIDGVSSDEQGNIIVSHWEGRVLRVSPQGTVTKLVDTTIAERQCADLEYVADLGVVVVPTFFDGRVVAYRLGAEPSS